MASYNKKQDFEQWLSEHDPDSKKYKYRDKSAYSYIREQKETASIPRTREVERAYAENPAGWENSKNMQAASVVPRAEDYRAAAYAYSVLGRQQKPTATSRNPRSSYYNPNWRKEINEREAQKRQAAQVAADNRAAEHAARIQQRSNAITSIIQRYASAPDFESGIEKGKALYSNTQGQSGEKTPSFMDIYSGALNPGSISPKAARGLVKQGERRQLDAMSEDEKNIYYYLLGTKGDAAANEFKSLLDDELNRRIGTAQAEQAEILGTAGVLPFVAGVESSYAGAAQALLAALGSEKTVPRSPYQYAYQAWRERIAQQENNKIGLRGIANDLGYTVGNMLPGMELSAAMGGLGAPSKLASALGSGSIGLSSGGNAYREGRDMGYSHNEAITYGALTGASEAGLQYLLGGVSKLGAGVTSGKVGNVVSKALDKVVKNKAVADTVARYVADMGSEATEEYLQSVLEPVFRNIAAGENNDIDLLSDEALYSAMMGALTAGLFNAPEMVSGINNARSTAVAEHLEPSNAQLKYFTPEEASDPRKSRSRMGAYAKEFGDVLNSTSPDPARMREMQDIVSEYNTLRAMNRADAIEQAATQAAARASQARPPENIRQAASQAAENAAQSAIKPETKNNTTHTAKEPTTGVATNETAAQPEANQETDKAKIAATALDNITKAGAMNTPYGAVADAYKEMVSTGVITPRELSDAYATGLAEYNKSHADTTGDNEYATKIANALSTLNKYVDNDIKYTIRGNDNWGYTAAVTRIRDNNGGVPIKNARDTLFIMSGLRTRQDAVDALVGASQNLAPVGTTQETVSPTEAPKVERKPPNDAMIQMQESNGREQAKKAGVPAKTAQSGVATRHTATTSNGNAVSVGSIVETDNGLNVRLSDGTTAQLPDVEFDDPNINALYERAADFDVDTANALVNNYTGETSVDNYLRGFNSVYLSGKQGYEYAKAVGDSVYARHYLNDNARMAAFRAGQAAYQSSRANSIAGQQGNNVRPQAKAEYEAGVNREYSDRKLTSSQRKQIRALDEVFKAAGKKLVIHDAIGTDGNSVTFSRSDANAYYDAKTDTYHLSLDSTGQAYAYITAHESVHEMAFKNKEGFSALAEVVEAAIEGELMNQKGMTFDEAKAEFEKMVQYQIDKNGLSRSEAVTEVVANTVPVILTDEQQGKRFADKVMKSGSKVKAWFEKLIKDLRAILDKAYNILKGQKSWEQMELIRNNKQTLDMIADYYFEGMEGAKGKASNTEKTDGNVKRSAKNINADIREVNPMEITPPNRVTSSSKYHYLINEFENNGYNGRNVVLVENGNDGYQALTGSHRILAAREAGVDVPSVVIPMSEEIQPLLDATGDEERARIADELYEDGIIPKEARDLLVREDELNFENVGKPLDKQVRFSTKNAVTESQQFKRWFGDWQNNPAKASKVVNEDGTPKVMYHGTSNGGFHIFNTYGGNFGLFGIGSYFTDNLDVAQSYTQKGKGNNPQVYSVYLNIRNPIDMDAVANISEWKKTVMDASDYFNGCKTNEDCFKALKEYCEDEMMYKAEAEEYISDVIQAMGYDGITHIGGGRYNKKDVTRHRVFIVFDNAQVKSATDNVGTFDPNNPDIRFSEKDTEQKAVSTFGTTYSWNETGYLTPSGKQLDFSGKRDGAQAGYRSMDHRDVSELYDAEGVGGTDAMIKFMNEGNIRISPEMGGINLQSMPTKAQFDKLQSFVRKNGGEVTIDFDDANGNTLHSIEYPQGTGPVRINNDIKRYYNEGKVPEISETQRFSFSRKDDVSVTPEDAKKLQKQNDKLKQALEVAKQEIKLSDGHHVKASAVERLAGSLLKEYSSKMDKAELVSNITELFDYIGNGENVVWDEVQAGAMNIALNVLDQSSKRNTEWYDNTKPAREFLKNNTIKLNEKQLAEVQSAFGSYTEFRRELYNKAKFSKTEGISLEQAWRDLSGMFPDTFDPDTPDVDMPTLLHDEVLNMYDRPIENPYGYGMKEYAADLAMRLYGEYMALPERKTFADKQQKKLEMQRARYNTLMEQQREQAKAKYEKLRDQRDITKYKTSIEKNAKSLYNWLTKPNNSKHVPEALRNKTADLLKTLEFDGKKGYMWKDAMRNLQTWMQQVDRAKTNPDIDNPLIEYAPDLIDNMQSLLDSASKYNNISDMPLDKLKELNNIVAAVKHTVTTANTVIADGRRQYIDDIGGNIIKTAQVQRPKAREFMRKHPYAYKMASAVSGFFNSGNVKPIYFFDNIGGEMKTLFNDVRQASYKSALTANTIREEYAQIKDKYHYKEWADKKGDLLTIQTNGGSNVSITREQALDIYATAKREKLIGTQHLTKDGFVFNKDIVQKNGKLIETATNDNVNKPLSEETIAEISDWLTKEQKGYADALVELMSTKGAELGNEVTMQMYGINRFAESYYIPIMSARQFIETAFNGRVPEAMSWMNKGFTKNTVAGARNPIVITGITQKALQHMADMATYNAMAIPQDTMAKVYNYKQRGEDGGANTYIRAELDKAYGQHTSKYIKTFINDISGNITVDPRDSMASKMISAFRRNAVAGKLSVAIQQPSAIVRATALVDPKYFFGHVGKDTYDTAKKYSGTAVIKEVGGFDAYTGKGLVQWMADNDKLNFRNVRDAVAGWLPQKMDEITWCRIWKACENEIADTTAFERGSEEFYKAVGHRFDDVIEYTQVYDSVISRSEYMRSKSAGAKLFTSFKAEPTVSYNMYWYALKHMNEKGGKARLLRTAASIIGAGVFNAILKSVITAIRDDDENQNYVDKYVEALAGNLVGTPLKKVPYIGEYIYLGGELDTLGSLPLVNEVLSLLQGYTSSRSELKVIQDLINAAGDLDNENKGRDERWLRMAKATSQMFGIPLDAFIKDWLGVVKEAYKAISGNEPELSGNILYEIREGLGVKQELELYKGVDKAITTGDYTRLDKQFKTMVERDTTTDPTKKARETVRAAVRQYFDAGEVKAGDAKRILVRCGYKMDDAEAMITKWDFWRDYPEAHDTSVENNTEKLAEMYFEHAKPANIDKAVFYDVYKFMSKQGTKKEEAMAYINKQNLTKAQKDALYLCKYAESKIDEAPWR